MCLSKTEEVELRNKSKFSCASCCFPSAFKTAFQRHPEILLVYPTFPGWPWSSQGRARASPSWERCNDEVSWLLFVARGISRYWFASEKGSVGLQLCRVVWGEGSRVFMALQHHTAPSSMRRGAFPLPGHFPSPSHQLVLDHWQPTHLGRNSKFTILWSL